MKNLILISLSAVLLGVISGCISSEQFVKYGDVTYASEEAKFTGIPDASRIDNATPNKKGNLKIGGHISYKYNDTFKKIYRNTTSDTGFFNGITITEHTSIIYEPRASLGGELTYSFTDMFGFGGQIDYAAVNFADTIRNANPYFDNRLSMTRTGFHFRFTKSHRFISTGYRPELFLGIFRGLKKTADSTLIYSENELVRKFFISFEQSMFIRVSPIQIAGIFAGLKHQLRPIAVLDHTSIMRNTFLFYGGVGMELLDMLSVNVYGAVPILIESPEDRRSPSIGLSLGINFNNEGDYND